MENNEGHGAQIWNDPRFFCSLLYPIGALIWAIVAVASLGFPIWYSLRSEPSLMNKTVSSIMVFAIGGLGGIYYTIAAYQIFFLELKERFIVRKARYEDGAFDLEGYYFKADLFQVVDVVSVEEVVADPRWFSQRTGTMLTRNPKLRCNFSLKATLKDGRAFLFPGELFEAQGIETMRRLLENK